MNDTRYPIYIISKGRAESRPTSKALEKMGVPYYIVIEPQEYDDYAAVIDSEKILTLPFSNHGKGSGPARNWCWEHSEANGYARHWLLDDNIFEFWRLHRNKRYRVKNGSAMFRAAEDFVDRYENISLAGFQYKFFCVDDYPYPPYIENTRIMSCFLIDNACPHKWRGKYNEDVDLSLRVLKDGGCTILFYAFLCGKARTGTMTGGNTEEVYGGYEDKAAAKSQMLVDLHPDVARLADRYGRIHHHVDISSFRNNKFILKKGVKIHKQTNNYGMKLKRNLGKEDEHIDWDFGKEIYPSGRKLS